MICEKKYNAMVIEIRATCTGWLRELSPTIDTIISNPWSIRYGWVSGTPRTSHEIHTADSM